MIDIASWRRKIANAQGEPRRLNISVNTEELTKLLDRLEAWEENAKPVVMQVEVPELAQAMALVEEGRLLSTELEDVQAQRDTLAEALCCSSEPEQLRGCGAEAPCAHHEIEALRLARDLHSPVV